MLSFADLKMIHSVLRKKFISTRTGLQQTCMQ